MLCNLFQVCGRSILYTSEVWFDTFADAKVSLQILLLTRISVVGLLVIFMKNTI